MGSGGRYSFFRIVEVDETFIGGKNRNRHWDKRTPGTVEKARTNIKNLSTKN